ncbi:hypothetical protein HELRODRAFT_181140 [Helobdella robusta]|uniref:PHD-type domain-containing protein n=1 Tax=Helobdella robusta TaxID=6412 RepID=T1FGN4_HELRO|nr:hypothetical protein HELRODRAFT_181140 [Helobdella robusta]ESN93213.1 hypothetical protein HELRODRAFT_181140 [Helobdella robusta]
MANQEKCLKCSTNKRKDMKEKDKRIKCYQCDITIPTVCANLPDEICDILETNNNLRWFCDKCSSLGPSLKKLTDSVESYKNAVTTKFNELNELNREIKSAIENINSSVSASEENSINLTFYVVN